jgi:hypothetical protein
MRKKRFFMRLYRFIIANVMVKVSVECISLQKCCVALYAHVIEMFFVVFISTIVY